MIRLRDDEEVQMIVRKHWFVLVLRTIGLLFLFALPFVLYALFATALSVESPTANAFRQLAGGEPGIPMALGIVLASAWTLIIWTRFFSIWTDHYLDTWIVTNRRIIDIDQVGFFNRRMASFRIERIQDITIHIKGLLGTLLNFGDIHVQTAGEVQDFIIRSIPDPKHVKQEVLDQFDYALDHTNQMAEGVGNPTKDAT